MRKLSDNWISDKNLLKQVVGALCKSNWVLALFLFSVSLNVVCYCGEGSFGNHTAIWNFLLFAGISSIFGCIWYVVAKLNKIFSLRRQETRITLTQIFFLICFGIWIVLATMLLGIKDIANGSVIIALGGSVLTWVFQDTIKSVAAFFYLRANGLLKIGDWIEVSSHGIDGMVRSISLTTVTVENWDTTTSAFPTYILHAEHFKNNQDMMEGKTHGRLMLKTFVLDTGWFHPLSDADCERLKAQLDVDETFKKRFVKSNQLNVEVFRQYIYHWLMNNEHVSHEPRLMVRWLQQTNEGMPLQIYAFITDGYLEPFEWQQSQVIEHFLKALAWFDLQLFQTPSGYDASNSNIFMTSEEANYRRKETDYAKLTEK